MRGFQVMPRLAADEYAELEQDIIDNGVEQPIQVTRDGRIVDGHHRDEIARKHDLHCPRIIIEGDEEKLRARAYSLNMNRRHLSRLQKSQVLAESIRADPQLSDREHARRTGSSPTTAGHARRRLEEEGLVSNLDTRTGADGVEQPIKMTRPEPAPKAKPKRRPLNDAFFETTYDVEKRIRRLKRLCEDDRFARNRQSLAARNLFLLRQAHRELGEIIAALEGNQ